MTDGLRYAQPILRHSATSFSCHVLLFDQKHLFFRPDLKLPKLPRADNVKDGA
jgi:hypothetical protein